VDTPPISLIKRQIGVLARDKQMLGVIERPESLSFEENTGYGEVAY
jgi:hypothetical protein